MSCQTIALWTGRPVRRDQTTVVSRWSLMPTAASARRVRADLTQRDPDAGPHALEDLVGVVLDPAGSRRDLGVLQLVAGDRPPDRSKRMQRLLVVPWSMAATSDRGSKATSSW